MNFAADYLEKKHIENVRFNIKISTSSIPSKQSNMNVYSA